MVDREGTINLILGELANAERKFPRWPTDQVHAAAIVGEEAGELLKASLQHRFESGSLIDMENEAIQTAAMAIRFLLNMQTYKKVEPGKFKERQ